MVQCSTCNVFHMRHYRRFFYGLAWLDTVEFNRLPCPNCKMYGDVVFAVRFGYKLTMFLHHVLLGLCRLLHAHIAYEIDISKIIAEIYRISFSLCDLIRLNSIACLIQTTRCRMILIPISVDYVWSLYIDRAISTPRYSYWIWKSYIKITTDNWHDAGSDLSCRTFVKC